MPALLIADDHPLFRAALRGAAAEAAADVATCEAESLDGVLALLEARDDIDPVLLDLHMPCNHGLAGLAAIRAQHPAVAVVLVSANEDPHTKPMIRSPMFRGLAGLLLLALTLPFSARAADTPPGPIHQLRVYEIFDDTRQAFHDRFRDHAARIMAKYDFRIVAIWESRGDDGRPQFVYLLEWPDEATMRDRWEKFMADEEWAEIKRRTAREHGQFVGDIEERTLVGTDYSPRRSLLGE